ncbi:hypothetical protein A8E16_03765 [Burkholderia cenocepacia]|nr:hypothetical protein A8E13_24265 [Burkholderia cenocepacia]ONR38593.1 hypothetical protein A8E11_13440 [Burkholderia cenocepacia]ONR57840.1 hypothetical protein A8E16_03765 [Burkholderia cenocepacia]
MSLWPAPQPLIVNIEPMEYPVEMLPSCIRAAVDEVCGFVKAPLPLVASCAIAALSLAIQAHFDVKRADRLIGPVGLYVVVVADSGERKSTCDSFFMRAIREYEAEQAQAAQRSLSDYRADIQAWESKVGGVKEHIRQATKGGKSTIALERRFHKD